MDGAKQSDLIAQWRDIIRFGRFFIAKARRRAWIALAMLLVASAMEGFTVLLLVPVLQSMDAQGGASITLPAAFGASVRLDLGTILFVLVAGVALTALVGRWRTIYIANILYDFINELRLSLYSSIAGAEWRTIARLRGSDLNHLLTADIDRVQSAGANILMLLQNTVLLAIYLMVSTLVSAPMTLFAAIIGALAFAVLHPIRSRAATYGRQLTLNRQTQYRTVSDFLAGLKVIRAANAEDEFARALSATLRNMQNDYQGFVRLNTVSTIVFQLALALGTACFVYVAYLLIGVPLAQIVVMIFIFLRIAPRFLSLQTHAQEIFVNLPAFDAMQRTRAICDAAREPRAHAGPAVSAFSFERAIELDEVRYSYDDNGAPVIDRISLTIPAKRITAIIGPSGSGKTTIADLLLGLLSPSSGQILIDGRPLTPETARAWRDQVAYVPQDTYLVHDTVVANLRLGAPAASDSEIYEALRAADALEFVMQLPQQLDTIISDRGARLSGGERQRLALARALLRRPSLLLLDEATSAIDWESQALLMQSISRLRDAVTVVTIAHRLSMVAFADWVIAIENGRVAEMGAYRQLIDRPGGHLSRLAQSERSQPASKEESVQ